MKQQEPTYPIKGRLWSGWPMQVSVPSRGHLK